MEMTAVVLLLAALSMGSCTEITVMSPQRTIQLTMRGAAAEFGAKLRDFGLMGYIVRSQPASACTDLRLPHLAMPEMTLWMKPKILLAQQGPCSYAEQVARAAAAGFKGILIFSNSSNNLVTMHSNQTVNSTIPAVFIGQMDGILLWDKYFWSTGFYVIIGADTDKLTTTLQLILILLPVTIVLIPLLVIIAISATGGRGPLILTAFRHAKSRMRVISQLPERKLSRDLQVEEELVCSICLEYFRAGEKVRTMVPCRHEFHSVCVDSWLMRENLQCPLCRTDVTPKNDEQTEIEMQFLNTYSSPELFVITANVVPVYVPGSH